MNKIKCIAIERSNLTNLAKSIEDFQNSHNLISKGSIPFSLPNGNVGVIMFFPETLQEINYTKEQVEENPHSSKTFKSKEKFKTPDIWKSKEPTVKQRNTLKKMGLSWEEINKMSMYTASERIGGKG